MEREMEMGKIIDEENESIDQQNINLVAEIVGLIESVVHFEDYRIIQRKECCNLAWRLKTLLPFLDEVENLGFISHDSIICLSNLKKTVCLAKKVLKSCHEGSKIYMALEGEAVMIKFNVVYKKLSQVLNEMPFHELEVSKGAREQIELMQTVLDRAKRRKETQDIELALDLMVVSSKSDKRNVDDLAIIERLAIKLELLTVEDLNVEIEAVRKLVKERGQTSESIKQTIELLKKFKEVLGMEVNDIFKDPIMTETLVKSQSIEIPRQFLCPITLEIMSEPVIVASGQTYERQSIERWFEANHHTCPKTGQTLAHLSLSPNYALKNLIGEWCEENNFQLPKKDDLGPSQSYFEERREKISSLIVELSSHQLDVQRKAVKTIRSLSKENPDTRVYMAENGAIPPLVQLLSYPDMSIQEHAVTTLMNLSIHESNKKLISNEKAIPAIVEVLQKGNAECRENSAAALLSLSLLDENKVVIALENGIPPLVNLLQNGTIRGKRDAATALFSLALNQSNKAKVIDAGILPPLLSLIKDTNIGMVDEALSIFLLLASHPEGRFAIGQMSIIGTLVDVIKNGTPKNKECATAVLLELASNNSSHRLVALQLGVYEHLVEISQSGTNRARRKAKTLLQLISKSEEIPSIKLHSCQSNQLS